MTPKYSWTPASEPPDTFRRVIAWRQFPDGDEDWWQTLYLGRWDFDYVTAWRDVEPPSGEGEKE